MFFNNFNGFNWAFLTLICVLLNAIEVENGLGQLTLTDVLFEENFVDKALRLELFQCGDARSSITTLHGLAEEPIWPENPQHLITPFLYGRFFVKVYDPDSERLIFSKGFDTLFAEYATTGPAQLGHKRIFETTTRIPMPKKPIKLTIDQRLGDNSLVTVFAESIDPTDVRIRRELVGAFQGGGYLAKGMYRAEEKCLMGTADPNQKFCAACKYGIEQMIDFYAPR